MFFYRVVLIAGAYGFREWSSDFQVIGIPCIKLIFCMYLTWNFIVRLPFYSTSILKVYGFCLFFLNGVAIALLFQGIFARASSYHIDGSLLFLMSMLLLPEQWIIMWQ